MTIEEAEKADEPLSHESAVFLLGQFAFDHFVMGEPAEWWDAHVEAVLGAREEAVRQAERERFKSVTRIEVIDHRRDPARCYSAWESAVEPVFQDDGRTLKLFVRARSSEEAGNG